MVVDDGVERCPKHMTSGPCGGVTNDGRCEVPGVRCPFRDATATDWQPAPRRATPVSLPDFVVDIRVGVDDRPELAEAASLLRERGAGVLIGDHVEDAGVHDPADAAAELRSAGLRVAAGLTCRGRTVDQLRTLLGRLVASGVDAVHCVTGDHPAARFDGVPEPVFELDSFGLVALAHDAGASISVGESPAARPTDQRPQRLAAKARAGAGVAILNHAGSVDRLIEFADACHEIVPDLTLVAPVPVITDVGSARALTQFPGLHLPPGLTERIFDASDPEAEGVRAAAEIGRSLRRSGRFVGCNLSGSGGRGGLVERMGVMAAVVDEIRSAPESSAPY